MSGVPMNWNDSPDDTHNLLNLSTRELYYIYSRTHGLSYDTIKRRRNIFIQKLKSGEMVMPPRSEKYPGKEAEVARVTERQAKLFEPIGKITQEYVQIAVPPEHIPYHEQLEEAIQRADDENAILTKAQITSGEHTMFIKNTDGEIEYTEPLKSQKIKYELDFNKEPLWQPVMRVESVKLPKKEREPRTGSKKAVVLPDFQIPFESKEAVETALKIVRHVNPDKIVILGDLLDLDSFSTFVNLPSFSEGTQEAVIRAHNLLVSLRKMCPEAEIVVLEGNHDKRLSIQIAKNARAAYGLRRADDLGGYPVLSVPHLCAFDQLDVEYLSGYPANRFWINENLQVIHGNRVRSSGSTAKLVSEDERVSTIFGHVHRIETQLKTHHTYNGGKTNGAYSIGCLCKLDGSVPSRNYGVDLSGNPVSNYENWQNGLAVIDYEEGNGAFNVQTVYINAFDGHKAFYDGRVYQTKEG